MTTRVQKKSFDRNVSFVLLSLVLALSGCKGAYQHLWGPVAVVPDTDENHFKYGASGTEYLGVPYRIWRVLPSLCADHLPQPGKGYASLGLAYEAGQKMPIGFSQKALVGVGTRLVGFNCALCHTATYRLKPDEQPPHVELGGPGHQFAAQGYLRFLSACTHDDRFTGANVGAEIQKTQQLSWLRRVWYRFLVWVVKLGVAKLDRDFSWAKDQPEWGRGRFDSFNVVKFAILGLPVKESVGIADIPPIWNLQAHEEQKRTGTIIPLDKVGTDSSRVTAWTRKDADTYKEFTSGYAWKFSDFRGFPETNGYVAVPLDGIWLRAPYLHNGSVPSLRDLLNPATDRPKTFYRGYDVYDQSDLGFVHEGPDATKEGFLYNTDEPGNRNIGHEFGTDLSLDEKNALLEYLKTL